MRTLWNTFPYSSGYWSGWRMYSSTPSFDSSFVLNDSGSSSTSPSRLPRMLVEYHPASPSIRALNAGASTVFIIVWPVLKSLPPMGSLRSSARRSKTGMSTVRFGARGQEHLRGRRPDHHQPVGARRLLERANIRAQLLGQVALGLTHFDVRTVQALHVAAVERRRHGLAAPEEIAYGLEVVRLEHAGLLRRGVRIIRNRIPGREHQVGEPRQGHELADLRGAALGAFAEPNRRHLRQRPDRQGAATPHILDAGDERRGDGSQPHEHHPQLSLGGRDVPAGIKWHDPCPFRDCSAGA